MVILLIINNTVEELKSGLKVMSMKDATLKVCEKDQEPLKWLMVQNTKVPSRIIIYMVLGITNGMMEESITEDGVLTRCMVEVYLHGKMVESMMVSTIKTKSMVKVCLYGLMGKDMMDSGLMVFNMALGFIKTMQELRKKRVNGKMERE